MSTDKELKPWQWREGDYVVTRSTAWSAPGCHDGCGVLVYTDEDGTVVKVEGDPDHAYNQGRLCARCLAVPEVLNHKDRLRYPMKRDRAKRGDANAFERCTWDEAYDIVERELRKVMDEHTPRGIAMATGTGRDYFMPTARLQNALGTPNFGGIQSGLACYTPRIMAGILSIGNMPIADCSQQFQDRYDNPSWRHPDVIVNWGCQPQISNADGFLGHWIIECMKRGSRLVVVDPRVTWLATKAEVHLQLRPGTDAAVALCLANIMIQEDLYDHDFIDKWTYGFKEFAERVSEYTPEKVAEISWVPEEKLYAAARCIANAECATVQSGVAWDMHANAWDICISIIDLFIITGNIDNPGGVIDGDMPWGLTTNMSNKGFEFSDPNMLKEAVGVSDYGFFEVNAAPGHHPDKLIEAMRTDEPYPIRALWLHAHNFLTCCGNDPMGTMEMMQEKLDFIGAVDMFMTPTIVALADIVLPVAAWTERDGLYSEWHSASAINMAADPGECKSDYTVCLDLIRRFRPEVWPHDTDKEVFDEVVEQSPCPVSYDEIKEMPGIWAPYDYYKYKKGTERHDGQLGFRTATGRCELWVTGAANVGLDPLPKYEEPWMSPVSTPELYEEYPLILTTGARDYAFFHSEHRQVPRLRRMHKWPTIQMHPETAEKYGLADGDTCWVENPFGKAKRRVQVMNRIDPRVVQADHAWWFPEGDPEKLFDMPDVNVNTMIPWGKNGPSGYGNNMKSLLCKIYRAEEGEEFEHAYRNPY